MDIQDLLSRFRDVTEQHDGGYLMRCPAHGDSRPSLRLWVGADAKARITCRAGCDSEKVVTAAGLTWRDMFDVSGQTLVVPTERPQLVGADPLAALNAYAYRTSRAYAGSDAERYASRRFGVQPEQAETLGLGCDPGHGCTHTGPMYRAHPRLTVPLRDFSGKPHGLQGRDLSGRCPGRWLSLTNPTGARWGQYGVLRGWGGAPQAIVCEGPGDGLTAASAGYTAVVIRGASLAANPELMAELTAGLADYHVFVAGDADPAGQAFNAAVAAGLQREARAITLPNLGAKADLTDWRERDPGAFPAELRAAIEAAQPVGAKPKKINKARMKRRQRQIAAMEGAA